MYVFKHEMCEINEHLIQLKINGLSIQRFKTSAVINNFRATQMNSNFQLPPCK